MAKFAIVWMWEANYSEKPIIVEAESAEKALSSYRMHSMYGEKFWATAKVFAFPAEGVRWMGNRPCEPVLRGRPVGALPEPVLTPAMVNYREITVLPPCGDLLQRARETLAKHKEAQGRLRERANAGCAFNPADAQASNEALDQFRWRAMEYVEMLLSKFPETKED